MNIDEIINICENVAQFETVGDESKAVFEATILIKSLEQELDKYKAGVVNVSKLELKLKKALDNFVYIHSWDDACNTSAFYTGFHLINKIIELLKGE